MLDAISRALVTGGQTFGAMLDQGMDPPQEAQETRLRFSNKVSARLTIAGAMIESTG